MSDRKVCSRKVKHATGNRPVPPSETGGAASAGFRQGAKSPANGTRCCGRILRCTLRQQRRREVCRAAHEGREAPLGDDGVAGAASQRRQKLLKHIQPCTNRMDFQ